MRNTFTTILALMAGAMLFGACSKEAVVEEPVALPEKGSICFTASIADDDESTRASLGASNSIVWNQGDEISVISFGENNKFTLSSGAGTNTGHFEGTCETGSDVYAIYPYSANNKLTPYNPGSTTDFIIDWNGINQTAVKGSFPLNTPMVAYVPDVEEGATTVPLSFQNVCALVKFTTDYVCKKVVFSAKGSSEYLSSDKLYVEYDSNKKPHVYQTGGSQSNTVTLTGKDGANLEAGTYYIAVMPGTLANGFDLTFTNIYEEMELKKETSNSVTLKRNTILNLGDISIKGKMVGMAGQGTLEAPYTIHDFDQLEEMRDFVNRSDAGAHSSYKLVADIDGGGKDFTPIGTNGRPFAGNFDGDSHTIKNIKLGQTGLINVQNDLGLERSYVSALFAYVKNATLKNVAISGMSLKDNAGIQLDSDKYYAFIKSPFVGVVIGSDYTYTNISNITIGNDQTCPVNEVTNERGKYNYLFYGGVVGVSAAYINLSLCTNSSVIDDSWTQNAYIGGIVGAAFGGQEDDGYLDYNAELYINECRNFGNLIKKPEVFGSNVTNGIICIGGILGLAKNYDFDDDVVCRIKNCVNFGTLNAHGFVNHNGLDREEWVGGIVGCMHSDGTTLSDPFVKNCINNGGIWSCTACGGSILGPSVNDLDIKIDYVANTGYIQSMYLIYWVVPRNNIVPGDHCKNVASGEISASDCVTYMNNLLSGSTAFCQWKLYSGDNSKLDLDF